MRVVVLNGVNLDVIGRRDPEVYGGLNIRQLESRALVELRLAAPELALYITGD